MLSFRFCMALFEAWSIPCIYKSKHLFYCINSLGGLLPLSVNLDLVLEASSLQSYLGLECHKPLRLTVE